MKSTSRKNQGVTRVEIDNQYLGDLMESFFIGAAIKTGIKLRTEVTYAKDHVQAILVVPDQLKEAVAKVASISAWHAQSAEEANGYREIELQLRGIKLPTYL
jgi:hypothetical protein